MEWTLWLVLSKFNKNRPNAILYNTLSHHRHFTISGMCVCLIRASILLSFTFNRIGIARESDRELMALSLMIKEMTKRLKEVLIKAYVKKNSLARHRLWMNGTHDDNKSIYFSFIGLQLFLCQDITNFFCGRSRMAQMLWDLQSDVTFFHEFNGSILLWMILRGFWWDSTGVYWLLYVHHM